MSWTIQWIWSVRVSCWKRASVIMLGCPAADVRCRIRALSTPLSCQPHCDNSSEFHTTECQLSYILCKIHIIWLRQPCAWDGNYANLIAQVRFGLYAVAKARKSITVMKLTRLVLLFWPLFSFGVVLFPSYGLICFVYVSKSARHVSVIPTAA